jgi:hypothetical protein
LQERQRARVQRDERRRGGCALQGMRDVPVRTPSRPHSPLSLVDGISAISGGSFTAAYYGLYRDAAFGRFEHDFLYTDTNAYIWGIYLLPWNWGWIVDPTLGTNDYMERVYDRTMFHGARFKDLAARGRPVIAIGATEISSGRAFIFTQDNFDLICSDLAQFPVARAVAASNGFPGLFSPVTLTNHADKCGGREPGWLRRVSESERKVPPRSPATHPGDQRRWSECSGLLGIQRRVVGGLFALFGLAVSGTIDRFNFETMVTFNQQFEGSRRRFTRRAARKAL